MTAAEIIEVFFDPRAIAVITSVIGLNITYFKWLSAKFEAAAAKIEKQYQCFEKIMDLHENKDQVRHEENLHRFETISVSLARLGSDNGTFKRTLI